MADTVSVLRPEVIDGLLEANDLEAARSALQAVPIGADAYAVVRIKLGLYDDSVPSGAAMQALIQLMRRNAEWPGAKELYQLCSSQAFTTRQSSHSHSHPPPPVDPSK